MIGGVSGSDQPKCDGLNNSVESMLISIKIVY